MAQDAIDTEPEREAVAQETAVAPDAGDDGDEGARPLPRWTIPLGIVAMLALVFVVGRLVGVGPAILLLATTALLIVVGFLFRAVQSVAEPNDEDALEALPPTLAEEQKRSALRALKELEFEKSVGNISAEDYEVIVERYREDAKKAMRAVDDERKGMRDRAEKLAKKAVGAEVGAAPIVAAAPKDETKSESSATACPKCEVNNDSDARFCKGCGAPLGDEA